MFLKQKIKKEGEKKRKRKKSVLLKRTKLHKVSIVANRWQHITKAKGVKAAISSLYRDFQKIFSVGRGGGGRSLAREW